MICLFIDSFFKELALETYLWELLVFTMFKCAWNFLPTKWSCFWKSTHFFCLAKNGLINCFVMVLHCTSFFIWPKTAISLCFIRPFFFWGMVQVNQITSAAPRFLSVSSMQITLFLLVIIFWELFIVVWKVLTWNKLCLNVVINLSINFQQNS